MALFAYFCVNGRMVLFGGSGLLQVREELRNKESYTPSEPWSEHDILYSWLGLSLYSDLQLRLWIKVLLFFGFSAMLVADHHLDDIKGRIMAVRRVSGLFFLALMFNQESGIRVVNKKSISDEWGQVSWSCFIDSIIVWWCRRSVVGLMMKSGFHISESGKEA